MTYGIVRDGLGDVPDGILCDPRSNPLLVTRPALHCVRNSIGRYSRETDRNLPVLEESRYPSTQHERMRFGMTDDQGKAARGSQFWLQKLVNEQPDILNNAIIEVAPAFADKTVEWVSPLASEGYAEYRDLAFLEKLGIQLNERALADFWPNGGPVWDGLARISGDEVLLVEAKSHIPEAVSPPSKASKTSLELIGSSLDETKRYLNGSRHSNWVKNFYQVTNRLAHLYLLRVLNGIPAHLLFVYFVGDREMNGPETVDEWKGAVKVIQTFLGVERTKLSPYVHHVYLDVGGI